jgi:hypothetical protein
MKILSQISLYATLASAIIGGLLMSCDAKFGSQVGNTTEFDSAKVIKQGVMHIFKTNTFAPTYYTQPVKIVRSPNVPANLAFSVGTQKCELVDKPAKFYADVFKPIPYVEVEKLKFSTVESAEVDLIFPATGHWFMLELKKVNSRDWKVVKMQEATI